MQPSYGRSHLVDVIFLVVLALACAVITLNAPGDGRFWWSEAPRNALNGAFIMDFLLERPFDDPRQWAIDYYYQYPALTILFYPPLFHVVLAVFYLVLGVSHETALACVGVFLFVLAAGVYVFTRRMATAPVALGAASFLLAAPEVMIWSQQVMLDIPMLAFAVWSAFFLTRYTDEARAKYLVIAAVLMVAALYTKQTAAILFFALFLAMFATQGRELVRRRHFWMVALVFLVALVPLGLMQWHFGRFNLSSVVDRADVQVDRFSLAGLTWYARHIADLVQWPVLVGAMIWSIGTLFRPAWRPAGLGLILLMAWLVLGYVALTLIDLKSTRFALIFIIPIVIFAALFLRAIASSAMSGAVPLVLGGAALGWTLAQEPTPWVSGYRQAAVRIAELAPADGRIMFAGNRAGSFIFNLRSLGKRGGLSVIDAKEALRRATIAEPGATTLKPADAASVAKMLNGMGVSYLVAEAQSLSKSAGMQSLGVLTASQIFEEVDRVSIAGHAVRDDLVLYRYRGSFSPIPGPTSQ